MATAVAPERRSLIRDRDKL